MGFGAPMHWIMLLLVVMLLFGGGRISNLMGDVAKGIKSFKKGMADEDETPPPPARPRERLEQRPLDDRYDHDPAPRDPAYRDAPRDADRPHGDR